MNRTTLLLIALASGLFACDAVDAPIEGDETLGDETLSDETAADNFGDETYYEDGTVVLSPRETDTGICECTTEECIRASIIEEFGCDICVTALCGGEHRGGCVICTDEEREAQTNTPDTPGCATGDECSDGL